MWTIDSSDKSAGQLARAVHQELGNEMGISTRSFENMLRKTESGQVSATWWPGHPTLATALARVARVPESEIQAWISQRAPAEGSFTTRFLPDFDADVSSTIPDELVQSPATGHHFNAAWGKWLLAVDQGSAKVDNAWVWVQSPIMRDFHRAHLKARGWQCQPVDNHRDWQAALAWAKETSARDKSSLLLDMRLSLIHI